MAGFGISGQVAQFGAFKDLLDRRLSRWPAPSRRTNERAVTADSAAVIAPDDCDYIFRSVGWLRSKLLRPPSRVKDVRK